MESECRQTSSCNGGPITTDSANSSHFLSFSLPFINPELLVFLPKEAELRIDVIGVPLQDSSGILHKIWVFLQSNVDILWDTNSLVAENGRHSCSSCCKERTMVFISTPSLVTFSELYLWYVLQACWTFTLDMLSLFFLDLLLIYVFTHLQ